jgi:hypothetical protein
MRPSDFDVIYRYEVPVDDKWHEVALSGDIVHVASRRRGVVEFWVHQTHSGLVARVFRVYGTGHPLPAGMIHRGTALDGPLVWHLMESTDG